MRAIMALLTTSLGDSSSTNRSPSGVAEQGAVAPQGLGQQGPGHGGMMQGGGVELHELDVGDEHPTPQGHGQAVTRGLDRIGRHREQLAGASGGQDGLGGPDLDTGRRQAPGP